MRERSQVDKMLPPETEEDMAELRQPATKHGISVS